MARGAGPAGGGPHRTGAPWTSSTLPGRQWWAPRGYAPRGGPGGAGDLRPRSVRAVPQLPVSSAGEGARGSPGVRPAEAGSPRVPVTVPRHFEGSPWPRSERATNAVGVGAPRGVPGALPRPTLRDAAGREALPCPQRGLRACAAAPLSGAGPPRSMPPLFATLAAERQIETLRDGPFVESPGMAAGDLYPGMGVTAPGSMARAEHGSSDGCLPAGQLGVPVCGSPGRCHVLCAAGREVAPRGTAGTEGHCWHPGPAGGHSPGWAHDDHTWRTRCEPGQG